MGDTNPSSRKRPPGDNVADVNESSSNAIQSAVATTDVAAGLSQTTDDTVTSTSQVATLDTEDHSDVKVKRQAVCAAYESIVGGRVSGSQQQDAASTATANNGNVISHRTTMTTVTHPVQLQRPGTIHINYNFGSIFMGNGTITGNINGVTIGGSRGSNVQNTVRLANAAARATVGHDYANEIHVDYASSGATVKGTYANTVFVGYAEPNVTIVATYANIVRVNFASSGVTIDGSYANMLHIETASSGVTVKGRYANSVVIDNKASGVTMDTMYAGSVLVRRVC